MSQRVLDVQRLNKAFSSVPRRSEDADALLATCYALAMQALYIGESVSELLILLRGCHVILARQWPQRLGTAFHRVESYCQLHEISERTNVIPVLHPSRYNPAIE
jgi:hypothetical protein